MVTTHTSKLIAVIFQMWDNDRVIKKIQNNNNRMTCNDKKSSVYGIAGLRRSSRHRKSPFKSKSWIFGNGQLVGYPKDRHYNSEKEDLCETRKVTRRQLSGRDTADEDNECSSYGRSPRFRKRAVGIRKKTVRTFEESDTNDGEDEEDDYEEENEKLVCATGRRKTRSTDVQVSHSYEEQLSSSTNMVNGDLNDCEESQGSNDLKEFEKPKRTRKPVERLSYEKPERKRQNKIISSSDESDNETNSNERRRRSRYLLRQNRKKFIQNSYEPYKDVFSRRRHNVSVNMMHSPRKLRSFASRSYRATHNTDLSSTSSASSDEKEFEKRRSRSMNKARKRLLPMNFNPEDMTAVKMRERSAKVGSSLADVDPMHIDSSMTFDSIGGLSEHIKSLKEMVIFPLMYPEVFQTFCISPPKGVLFYGSPGTGKTLIARALAAECSKKGKKVAFFMRKGADCLSKWVGESERQLRILFDQAYQLRPSIIFFDEIDGLAPVRSSRQDQIHSSIVSTLLALLDGLDDRGQIIVIGATNRIDAIDPALRRPGRFDRELFFPLPAVPARKQILDIQMRHWSPKPTNRLIRYLADETVGYCGADLKALCSEACLNALRSRYPQIYQSEIKLLLDVSQIQIKLIHFRQALRKIIPAGQRVAMTPRRKLGKVVYPLLQSPLSMSLKNLEQLFPHGFGKLVVDRIVHRPRFLISGSKGQGQTNHLAPAILHALEKIPTFKLDYPSLFSVTAKSPEEACAQTIHEALRNVPSILYIPSVDQWWESTIDTVKKTFVCLLQQLDPCTPLLILATSEIPHADLQQDLQEMFCSFRCEVVAMENPKEDYRRTFFKPIFFTNMRKKVQIRQSQNTKLEMLPEAPPAPPPQFTAQQLKKIEQKEEVTLRELRIFLREICSKLAKNRMFYIFTKPVDVEEIPDYIDIIKMPMDLETMMTKIDQRSYKCAEDFLCDIDLICSNALEYNPPKTQEDKLIRHRAYDLRDTAYALIKTEMDTDFEGHCQEIREVRRNREGDDMPSVENEVANIAIKKENDVQLNPLSSHEADYHCESVILLGQMRKKRKARRSNWARGCIKKKKKTEVRIEPKEINVDVSSSASDEVDDIAVLKEEKSPQFSPCQRESGQFNLRSQAKSVNTSSNVDSGNNFQNHNGVMDVDSQSDTNNTVSANVTDFSPVQIPESKRGNRSSGCLNTKTKPAASTSTQEATKDTTLIIDEARLNTAFNACISATRNSTVDELYYLYAVISGLIKKYKFSNDKTELLNEFDAELKKFVRTKPK